MIEPDIMTANIQYKEKIRIRIPLNKYITDITERGKRRRALYKQAIDYIYYRITPQEVLENANKVLYYNDKTQNWEWEA